MSLTPSERMSELLCGYFDVSGIPVSAGGRAVGWPFSQSGLRRLLRGGYSIPLDTASELFDRLAEHLHISREDVWGHVFGGQAPEKLHPMLSLLQKGVVWPLAAKSARLQAARLASMCFNAKRILLFADELPLFLFPKLLITELLLAKLERGGCRSAQILKAERRFLVHLQERLLEYGEDIPEFMLVVPEERMHAVARRGDIYESLSRHDVGEIRDELVGCWVVNRVHLAVVPQGAVASCAPVLTLFRNVMLFDEQAALAQPLDGVNRILCHDTSRLGRRCVQDLAAQIRSLLSLVNYPLAARG